MKNKLSVVTVLLLLIVAAAVFGSVDVDGSLVTAAPAGCSVQGAWVSSFSGGPWDDPLIMLNTLTPQDPAGKKMVYVMRLVNPDATFAIPPFAETDNMSELIGEAVKTGSGTYNFSLVGYGVKEREADRNEIMFIWTLNGSLTCEDDNRTVNDVNISIYTPDQDADQDGLPDEGAEPMACIGPTDVGSAQRIPMMPRCEPPPE